MGFAPRISPPGHAAQLGFGVFLCSPLRLNIRIAPEDIERDPIGLISVASNNIRVCHQPIVFAADGIRSKYDCQSETYE